MIKKIDKNAIRKGRHQRIRNKISGTAERPRMNVYRSNANIYVQVIDDVKGHTICSCEARRGDSSEESYRCRYQGSSI